MKHVPLDLPFTTQFFSGYLVDHFHYKAFVLYNVLQKYPQLKSDILDGLEIVNDGDFEKSIRLEIRATYFQAMETLFELIFSLEPRGGLFDNRRIWYFLSTARWRKNLKRIESIAQGETDFLDRDITANKNVKVPFIQYLFFFGVSESTMQPAIQASFDPIKKFLVTFAKEFTDRAEYNAFKHALRILPAMRSFEAINRVTQKPLISWDMTRSVSYLTEGDDRSISLETRPLDTERDMRMTQVCSHLISNIVRTRKAHFVKGYKGVIHTLAAEALRSATKRTIPWMNFKFTIKSNDNRKRASSSGPNRACG
jgi:hypothetical protein